jgi:putative nucleotidyltransferase with HDIG domain
MTQKILIVHSSPKFMAAVVLDIMARERNWTFEVVATLAEAEASLRKAPYAAVVVDYRISDGEGLAFLDSLLVKYPQPLRFLLANPADPGALLKLFNAPHHVLPGPWDAGKLAAGLKRAFSLELWATDDNVKRLMWHLQKVPSPPTIYFRVVKLLRTEDVDVDDVAREIAMDQAMTSKLLKVANSALFGSRQRVTAAREAVMQLGLEMTKSLLLLAHSFSYFDHVKAENFSLEDLWQHSLRTGLCAQAIARREGQSTDEIDAAYAAGLLHDIGKLVLAANLPREYSHTLKRAAEQKEPLWQAELAVFGATHADVGATLFGIWELPEPIIEAVALHHHPTRFLSSGFCTLTAVHAADALDHFHRNEPMGEVDLEYLRQLGVEERLTDWQESTQTICGAAEANVL